MTSAPYKTSVYNLHVPLATDTRSLLYNTLSQSFAVLTDDERRMLAGESFDPSRTGDPGLLDRLILNGFVLPGDIDEIELVEKHYSAARNDGKSLLLTIAPTLFCNFGCDYCFQGSDKPTDKMSPTVMDAVVRYVDQNLAGLKMFHVSWYGGEPLLGLPVIQELSRRFIAMCTERGVAYNAAIITNGHMLTRETAAILRECRVELIQITLDGAAEYHDARRHLLSGKGTYARIVENIASWLDELKFQVSLRVNVDHRNRESVIELIDDLHARDLGGKTLHMYFAPVEATTAGCSHISDFTLSKSDYGEMETQLFLYAYRKKLANFPFPPKFMGLCGALRPKALVITPKGDLHKCWDTVAFEHQKIGTIFDVDRIHDNPLNRMWNDWSPFRNSSCRNCRILPACTGACAYKFVHSEETRGEAAILPCPSWKFNIKEKLLHLAQLKGYIAPEQIPPGTVTNPQELCCYEVPGAAEALPDKILLAKQASYARAAAAQSFVQIAAAPAQ